MCLALLRFRLFWFLNLAYGFSNSRINLTLFRLQNGMVWEAKTVLLNLVLHMNLVVSGVVLVLCLPRCDVGTLGHNPGTFLSWWSMVCLGMFSAPAFGTFYILDGATYAELEQIETRSSFGGGYILGNVSFWFRTQLKT